MSGDDKQRGKDLKCRQCSATMGIISSSGLPELANATRVACDVCRPFEELHDNIHKTDEAFKQVQSRRSGQPARQDALENQRSAHRALGNFVQQLEQVDSMRGPMEVTEPEAMKMGDLDNADLQGESNNTGTLNEGQTPTNTSTASSIKRARSPTVPPNSEDPGPEKRSLKRKRVNFDATAVLLEEYRSTGEFHRGHGSYTRGRNAAPKGTEFLDTSGMNQMFRDFHQMTWNRSRRIWENDPVRDANQDTDGTSEERSSTVVAGDLLVEDSVLVGPRRSKRNKLLSIDGT